MTQEGIYKGNSREERIIGKVIRWQLGVRCDRSPGDRWHGERGAILIQRITWGK
ncbi:predicted protein [Sclerotinia sclerotiorum 1980 UF-70]|uniref:Uncharacterized protein n=1 Tax=Sclerotinia sclerotiorum (strain ATCC 18683 / 1980 / Ss-1) TaxID=665079 RepID=A7EBA9_SCLS1|nr:predicted protein [Sclerotinia sclerotiorum 1980 UF-70]EDN99737.1 predicted protein [Sclerotinia sclerotiorum 1980 UF-70]